MGVAGTIICYMPRFMSASFEWVVVGWSARIQFLLARLRH